MVGDIPQGSDGKPSAVEIEAEFEKLKEYIKERESKMIMTIDDSRKIEERLKAMERHVNKGDHTQAVMEKFIKTFYGLTCECAVINKKLKYLRKIMKFNTRKLRELEAKISEPDTGKEDKFSQTDGKSEDEGIQIYQSNDVKSDSSPDGDALMSEMFYLPTHPELPDLRLFSFL